MPKELNENVTEEKKRMLQQKIQTLNMKQK